jgi:hypothetical protein
MFVIFDYLIMFLSLYGAYVWLPDQFEMFEMERKKHYEKLRYILVCVLPRHEIRRSKWDQHHRMKPFQERLEFRQNSLVPALVGSLVCSSLAATCGRCGIDWYSMVQHQTRMS